MEMQLEKEATFMDNLSQSTKIKVENLSVFYGSFKALTDVSMEIYENRVTALIGPSGCGKSTFLRSLNRLNDLVPNIAVNGKVLLDDNDIYAAEQDVIDVRRRVGIVFQRPNPFPMSIFDNVAYGPRLYGIKKKAILAEIVEKSLRGAALWDDVKDKLNQSGMALSGGQQQRLCIARTIAIEPEVILMDEPASALDPVATLRIEELIHQLREHFTIVIVTHNMQQAARISDYTAFFDMNMKRAGYLVEYDETETIFTNPKDHRTEEYITGRFG